ncbi:MAG: hypothetical protein P4M01_01435 [Acidobacteriota bacterium]|nr:hypothetical protein [Acidobacteriota bacterium]
MQKITQKWTGLASHLFAGSVLLTVLFAAFPAHAEDNLGQINIALKQMCPLTTITADRMGVNNVRCIATLHKDKLQTSDASANAPITTTYKDGSLSCGMGAHIAWGMAEGLAGQETKGIVQKQFSSGEKFFVYHVEAKKDGIHLLLLSDVYDDARFYGELKVQFPKNSQPSSEDALRLLSEVVTLEDSGHDAAAAPADVQPAPVTPPQFADVPPPPPPVDTPPPEPKTIAKGQTKQQVQEVLGVPQKVVRMPPKEIDYYSDMKVIFVHGVVTDVQ